MTKTYKWGTIVPLIGGQTIAGRDVTGHNPDALLTYTPFADNEKNIRAYMPDVPYEVLDDGGNQSALKDADFISALCPCAGLSTLGTGSPEMREAANSWIFKSADHVLGTLRPKVFWGENAPALYSENSEKALKVRQRLEAIAQANGYTVSYYFTSTHMHGVPQRRHRTFYFMWRENGKVPVMRYWKRPTPTWGEYMKTVDTNATQHQDDIERATRNLTATRFPQYAKNLHGDEWPNVIRERMKELKKHMWTVQDYILNDPDHGDKPTQMRDWFASNNDEKATAYVDRILAKIAGGKGVWDDSPAIFMPDANFNALIGRTTDSAHPYEHRSLTVRECLHMMALPNDFKLVTKTINHICQNVPVCTASDMQRDVLAYINGELPLVDANVVFQNNFKEVLEESRTQADSKLLVF